MRRLDDWYLRKRPEDRLIDHWIALEAEFLAYGNGELRSGCKDNRALPARDGGGSDSILRTFKSPTIYDPGLFMGSTGTQAHAS